MALSPADGDATENSEAQQAIIFDKTTEKGSDGQLFQACMKSIRMSHASANRLRTGLIVAGLFTDKKMYLEAIVLFYAATDAMEKKLLALDESRSNDSEDQGDEICAKLLSLGYRFGPQYEQDIQALVSGDKGSSNWEAAVEKILANSSDGARAYVERIRNMSSGAELAGAAFCLWGALIIGGGAAAKPRVQVLCGKNACHLFEDVTGPGRGERKAKFIQLWDSLVKGATDDCSSSEEETKKDNETFTLIVATCQDCMQGNNELITSVKCNPWWLKYMISTAVGAVAIGAFLLLPAQRADRHKLM